MAGIIAYPMATPEIGDLLLGTEIKEEGAPHLTKNFAVLDIVNLAKNTTLENGWSGIFLTSDILEITVVEGIITNVVIAG
jgi:hypothetical protein